MARALHFAFDPLLWEILSSGFRSLQFISFLLLVLFP